MVCNSIFMLRQYNRDIPVKIYFINDFNKTTHPIVKSVEYGSFTKRTFLEIAEKLNAKIETVCPFDSSKFRKGLKNYFFCNRSCLTLEEDSVLHIDGDTFINGNVEELFDKYQDVDVAVPISKFYIQSGFSCKENTPPFNAAVILFNNKLCKKWANEIISYMNKTLDSKWFGGKNYPLEEISTNYWVCDNAKNIGYFEKSECYPVENNTDLLIPPKSIIIHTYVQQWPTLYKSLRTPLDNAIKIPTKPKMFRSKKTPPVEDRGS